MNSVDSLDLKIPASGHPTEVLAARFASWRKIIRALNVYFKEYASVQDEVVRHNVRLGHAVSFPFFQFGTADSSAAAAAAVAASAAAQSSNGYPIEAAVSISSEQQQSSPFHLHAPNMHPEDDQTRKMFLPFGSTSIADVPGNIIAFHRAQAATASRTSKELNNNIIPRLEDLRRDLLVKIKEIKNLASDFKNAVYKEQASTHKELVAYINACEVLNANPSLLVPKHDPFLLKFSLNKQITRQVNEENYLLEAFLNIQTSGKELERVVVQEIQQALNMFGRLTGIAAQNIQDLLTNKILSGFVAKEATAEWESFITRDPNFVDPNMKLRNVNELEYPNMHSSLAHDIRSGYLERRSKYLKSYSKSWYVLTPSFLHEFKSNDRRRDPLPVMSLSLNDCMVTYDKKSRSDSHKFILNAHQSGSSGISGKGHNWVFRAETKEKLEEWFQDLSLLSQIGSPVERAKKYFPSQAPIENKVLSSQRPLSQPPAGLTAVIAGSQTTLPLVRTNGGFNIDEGIDPLTPTRSCNERPVSAQVTSPVFSDTSEVTSTGEPYAGSVVNEDYKLPSPNPEFTEEQRRPGPRGRFPSEVNLNKYMVDTSSNVSVPPTPFIIPNEQNKLQQDDEESSVFSYDLKKETHSTLLNDSTGSEKKFTIGGDDICNTSVVSNKSGPQRYNSLSRATGSYGVDNIPDGFNNGVVKNI